MHRHMTLWSSRQYIVHSLSHLARTPHMCKCICSVSMHQRVATKTCTSSHPPSGHFISARRWGTESVARLLLLYINYNPQTLPHKCHLKGTHIQLAKWKPLTHMGYGHADDWVNAMVMMGWMVCGRRSECCLKKMIEKRKVSSFII